MTGRLKRRSSIAFTENNRPVERTEVVDDEAERRARNLQRKQAQTTHFDSPQVASEKASRRSIGGISGLTATQLAEHYNSCIKLSAENKISTKNAFNLQLIDYMATMIKKKESDMSNFQVAAGTLDASTKIYACRVDAVYGDTLKIASGLGNSTKPDDTKNGDMNEDMDGGVDGNGDPTQQKTKRKKIKKSDAVEKNLKNLNIGKFDLAFDVDPLFKKTAVQLGNQTGGNQFLYTLEIKGASQDLLLDPDTGIETAVSDKGSDNEDDELNEMEIPRISATDASQICPSFANFSFTTWSLEDDENDDEYNRLNQSISASQEERYGKEKQDDEEHAFDAFAEPEPVGDLDGGDDHFDDGGLGGPDYDDEDASQFSERALGQHAALPGGKGFTANLPMTTSDMLSVLTTTPLEYSYFDQGKIGAWAGPKHWKFKPMAKVLDPLQDGPKNKKKKVINPIGFVEFDEEEDEMMSKMNSLFSEPKKSIKLTDKTMKGWNRDKNTLPEDFHYSGHELVRLKICDQMVVVSRKSQAEMEVDDVEDYDYDNAADKNDYCPDNLEDDDYGGDDAPEDNIDTSFDADSQNRFDSQGDYGDVSMVDAPKLVDKAALQIGYAKTAKKVDMKRIKNVCWNILTHSSADEKENIGASPEKQSTSDVTKAKPGTVEQMNFTSVFHELKQPTSKLPAKMSDGLTVPLALLALLHLCNEQSLELEQDPSLVDFKIRQG